MKLRLVCWLAVVWFPGLAAGDEPPASRSFALVIGVNHSPDPERSPLRYADDDAVQNANLMTQLGASVILLVHPDKDSRQLYPQVPDTPPTRAAVGAALDKLNRLMERDRGERAETVLYLFYSGHGDVENNQGYVHLADGRLTRDDLLGLLRDSKASTNHLIIDACKSYFLVFGRGVGGERRSRSGPLLAEDSGLPANTGVMLSTSSAADSHEWEAFQGGVFSHELRSALRGAADLDSDGSVTYEEASAFVWTANLGIPNPRYRPAFFSRPPKDTEAGRAVLADLQRAAGDRLLVDTGAATHWYIEDGKGQRLVDLHPQENLRVTLLLPSRRPLFMRPGRGDEEFELPAGTPVRLSSLTRRETTSRARGAEHVAFRRLFARPFGQLSVEGYRSRPPEAVVSLPPHDELAWVRRSLGIAALAFGATGGTFSVLAAVERDGVDSRTDGITRSEVNRRINRYNTAAVTFYALAGAALAAYLVWTLWPEDDVEVQLLPSAGPGAQLLVRF